MALADSLPYSSDLADFWLGRAVLHLATACGMSEASYDELAGGAPITRHVPFETGAGAALRRLDAARMVVLTAALAAEAAVNGYIHAQGSSYRNALERLAPAEKLALAPRVLSGADPFSPGSRLQQRLVRLFELRDELVRPRPVGAGAFETFSPQTARELLEASARAIDALGRLYRHPCGQAAGWALRVATTLGKRAEAASALPVPSVEELEEAARQGALFPDELPIGA